MKHLLTAAVLVLGLSTQAAAQQETFAYAGKKSRSTKTVSAEKGYKLSVQQESPEDLRFIVQIDNPRGEKLTFSIKDENENVLFRQVLDPASAKTVARYNMDSLEDGAYTFEVRNGREKLEKAIDIRTQTQINRVVSVE